ncbi:HAMP domain-containing sensor histidine kinase [Salisediminibacterium beveridgei]|uniref:histidine kinase n=1 Tax=Salisediminibacterium beveridgei TaxID=632773 RepID=A0A1D7QYC3_9BACI|nr:HAMP domain-containing sensor histidine kinase [Salisediminibacterium beveridgei]AOM83999.1 sensor histidine kinase [Salisediminibacterium beveridgei]
MIRSIFGKLFLSFSGIIITSFLLFGLMYLYLFHVQLYSEFEETFDNKQEEIQAQLALAETFDWSEEETELSLTVLLSGSDFDVVLYDEHTPIFAGSDDDPARHLLSSDLESIEAEGIWQEGSLNYVMAGPFPRSSLSGMTMTHTGLEEAYMQALFMIAVSFLTVILIAGFVLYFITRRMTRPLREMNTIARQMSKGDFSRQVDTKTQDEIGELGKTLNQMAVELSSIEETRKTILTNISHDLRTPLTSVKGFLIALEDGTIPDNKQRAYFLKMRKETDRVITLVNAILELTRLESGNIRLNKEHYGLIPQLEQLRSSLEQQLTERNLSMEIHTELEEPCIHADYERMNRVFENLLVNAIHFADANSAITVTLSPIEHGVSVSIHNEGKPIPDHQLPYLFDRFYKGEDARSGHSGSGIGLAIVQSIVAFHQGTVAVRSEELEGTTFIVNLPSDDQT